MEEWQDCFDRLKECLDELENALHLGNMKRIQECRKWVNEAEAHEREAFKKAMAERKGL